MTRASSGRARRGTGLRGRYPGDREHTRGARCNGMIKVRRRIDRLLADIALRLTQPHLGRVALGATRRGKREVVHRLFGRRHRSVRTSVGGDGELHEQHAPQHHEGCHYLLYVTCVTRFHCSRLYCDLAATRVGVWFSVGTPFAMAKPPAQGDAMTGQALSSVARYVSNVVLPIVVMSSGFFA